MSVDMQHDQRVGRTATHRNETVSERLSCIAHLEFEQVAMIGLQGGYACRRGCPLVREVEVVKELIRLTLFIHCGCGHLGRATPGEDNFGSDRQPQKVARNPPAASAA